VIQPEQQEIERQLRVSALELLADGSYCVEVLIHAAEALGIAPEQLYDLLELPEISRTILVRVIPLRPSGPNHYLVRVQGQEVIVPAAAVARPLDPLRPNQAEVIKASLIARGGRTGLLQIEQPISCASMRAALTCFLAGRRGGRQ
jgi:hypothetical protein